MGEVEFPDVSEILRDRMIEALMDTADGDRAEAERVADEIIEFVREISHKRCPADQCCRKHQVHVMPHRGCILR